MRRASLAFSTLILAAGPAFGQAAKTIAVLDVDAKVGIDQARADVFSELVQDHIRNRLGFKVIGRSDIESMLGLEKMKDMLDCQDDSACLAELGGALGVDEMVSGSLAKLGSYLVVTVKRIDPNEARVLGQTTRRLKEATDDDMIEAVGPMIDELFGVEREVEPEPEPKPDAPRTDTESSGASEEPAVEVAEEKPAPEPVPRLLDWPVRLGVMVGAGMDGLSAADGVAFSGLVYLEPVDGFEIDVGAGAPFHFQIALRYWFRFGVFEVGPVVHGVIFERIIHDTGETIAAAVGGGAAVGLGWETTSGRWGVRADARYSYDTDLESSSVPVHIWVAWGI